MVVFFAVIICKILHFIGKRIGKGSSFPGKFVLKLFPGVLARLHLPDIVIAVTGSNGKTTVSELIVRIFEARGFRVGWNREGSNQTEGVATLLLRIASFGGTVKRDAVVMECDERYAKMIFQQVKPAILVVTNLCRDQLTRNGHPEFIEDCIRAAIIAAGDGVSLVLNADDPYVAALAVSQEVSDGEVTVSMVAKKNRPPVLATTLTMTKPYNPDVFWFGFGGGDGFGGGAGGDGGAGGFEAFGGRSGMYDDGAFCPVCKARMIYSYRVAGHYGDYKCSGCGLSRVKPDVEVVMQDTGRFIFNGNMELNAVHPSITNAYNFCAAVVAAGVAGVEPGDSVNALDGYDLTGGRVLPLDVCGRGGLLLLSKHENSFAYDCSLNWVVDRKKPCTVIVLVDAVSRKYYTSETSWLWDIDFDLLADECVKNVVLAGRYVNELGMRFALSSVNADKTGHVEDLSGLREFVERETEGEVFALTCFSDKAKLLKALE